MKIITRQSNAESAAKRFAREYGGKREEIAHWARPATKGDLIDRLNALSSPVDPDLVDAIIGNNSWTGIECHECGDNSPSAVVELGQTPDYESYTACICLKCLGAAVQMIEEAQ